MDDEDRIRDDLRRLAFWCWLLPVPAVALLLGLRYPPAGPAAMVGFLILGLGALLLVPLGALVIGLATRTLGASLIGAMTGIGVGLFTGLLGLALRQLL
ncbi:hypothetical protein [Pseudoxanthomonas putridarboris]|uniref:Uncharacterized protein n=1 Tax=Pseudoxanthomonas putridarboris TaxID=752605 RepID=A0ABU9J5W8_9GAMM